MTIKLNLSKAEIKDLSKRLKNLKKELKKVDDKIEDKLADFAMQEIQKNIASTPFKEVGDDVKAFKEKRGNKTVVGMKGTQAVYDEFGTGTEGLVNSHPIKSKYPLNPYNSGKTIRKNTHAESTATMEGIPQGGMYWTYTHEGEKIYTQGIPAGMQVYNAMESLKQEKERIVKEEVGELLSKL